MTTLLFNSLLTATATAAFASLVGFVTALAILTLPPRPRRVCVALCAIALAIPPFVVANCWLHYLGATGIWRCWLPVNLFSAPAVIALLTFMYWPIPCLASLGAWQSLAAAHFECEPALRGGAAIRWLLWPTAKGSIAAAAVVTFALALNQFSLPAILQVKVLPVEVWIRYSTELNPADALLVAWPLIVAPLAVLAVLRFSQFRWPGEGERATARLIRRQLGDAWNVATAGCAGGIGLLSIGLPVFQLVSSSRTWSEMPRAIQATWPNILNSFLFAAVAATVAVVLAAALWRSRLLWLSWVTFLIPGMLVGIGIIVLLNRPVLDAIYRSIAVIIIALVVRYCGPVWTLMRHSFKGVDPAMLEAARLDGAHGWSLFRHVYWPRVAPACAAAWGISYVLCLWDVETIALIVPPGADTLALRIFNLLHYGHNAQVNALCVVLLALAAGPALIYVAASAVARRRIV